MLARILVSSSFALLWLLSTPFIAESMLQSLEGPVVQLHDNHLQADAIVVLSGGSYFHAPEYAGDTVSPTSLQRIRYAAKLYHEVNKPILLAGGSPRGGGTSEAQQMKQVLEQEFNIPVTWLEEDSDNTYESARNCFKLLHKYSISRVYLITQAWHMPRASMAFESAGLDVISAPTAFTTRYQNTLMDWLPTSFALHNSQIYIHEIIGILWYRLKS